MKNIIKEIEKEKINVVIYNENYDYVVKYFIRKNIKYQNFYSKDNLLYFTILKKDYKKINKIFKTKIVGTTGIFKLKESFLKYRIFIFSFVICIFLIFIMSNIIINIKVYSSDPKIRNIIYNELENAGITRLSFDKTYHEKEKIKKRILKNHENTLEWLEFEKKGMTLVVNVEKRIIKKENNKQKKYCHIVASKDGLLKNVRATKGMKVKDINDYVKKGDIIISGEIKNNEEIKANTCASGDVFATIWYVAYVKIPRIYEEKQITKNKFYNIKVKHFDKEYKIFRDRYKNNLTSEKLLFHFFNYKFYLQTNYQVKTKKKKINKKNENKIIYNNIKTRFQNRLKDYEYIEKEKILKKNTNNSTIEAEVFLSVYKKIGKKITYEEVGDESDRIDTP